MSIRILVAHPNRQYSHQLVRALEDHGMLAGYWTGVPTTNPSYTRPLQSLIACLSPQPPLDLPRRQVRHFYVAPIIRRVVERLLPRPQAVWWEHKSFAWFDRWVANHLPSDIDGIVCYENSALETFRQAKKAGITTILDAASFHHEWQDNFYEPIESDQAHEFINRRKDKEIQLAEHVLTLSDMARESYVDAGVPSHQVTSIPLGADQSIFTPLGSNHPRDSQPFRFIFAGQICRRKGVDLLLEASERVANRSERDHRVQLAGNRDEGELGKYDAPVEYLGYLNRKALAQAFQKADCFVLPSRHDSFGMVVAEAMSTGLPVIVSKHVGAKELVLESETGWMVPAEDSEALAERMRWCVEHPEKLFEMRKRVTETREEYSWEYYRDSVVRVLREVV